MDEVLFINNIFNMKYYFDLKELKNIFYSKMKYLIFLFQYLIFFKIKKKFSTINFNLKLNLILKMN